MIAEEQPFYCDPTDTEGIKLCIDCIHARVKGEKYYCRFSLFYKTNYLDIVLYTPEDFGCCNYESDD